MGCSKHASKTACAACVEEDLVTVEQLVNLTAGAVTGLRKEMATRGHVEALEVTMRGMARTIGNLEHAIEALNLIVRTIVKAG